MKLRTVRAAMDFKTPSGHLKKVVNWSHYETKAIITASPTSEDAFDKFLVYGKTILRSSAREMRFLDRIYFYEEERGNNFLFIKKVHQTPEIKIIRDGDEIIRLDIVS